MDGTQLPEKTGTWSHFGHALLSCPSASSPLSSHSYLVGSSLAAAFRSCFVWLLAQFTPAEPPQTGSLASKRVSVVLQFLLKTAVNTCCMYSRQSAKAKTSSSFQVCAGLLSGVYFSTVTGKRSHSLLFQGRAISTDSSVIVLCKRRYWQLEGWLEMLYSLNVLSDSYS